MNDDYTFPDQTEVFRQQQQALERRRQLAKSLIAKGLETDGQMVSGFYIPKSPWENFVQGAAGGFTEEHANTQGKDLATQQAKQQNELLTSIPSEGPERQQAQLRAMQNPSLRDVIKAQMGMDEAEQTRQFRQQEAEAARLEKSEQEAANRVAKAEENAANRQNQKDLRAMPTQHISISSGGNSNGPRDRYSVQQGPDGKMYRVNLETGQGTPITIDNGAPLVRPNPAERKTALVQDELIGKVDNALAELEKNPDAVGLKTYVPNVALQRYDPAGVQARSYLAELGAEKAHELYGASFTAPERARADQFIPAAGDDLATVKKKLQGMKKLAEQARTRAMGQKPSTTSDKAQTVAPGTKGMHKGKPVVMGTDGEWHYAN